MLVPMLVLTATLLGFAIRIFRLDHAAPWYDELTSILYTKESWARLVGELAAVDVHPPLYYLVLKLWGAQVGEDVFSLRLLSVLLGTACIPLIFLLGRRLISEKAGVIAAFLLTTVPLHVFQSRELRMYSLLNLALLTAVVGLAYAIGAGSRARRFALSVYIMGSVIAFYAHNTAIIFPVLALGLATWLAYRKIIGFQELFEFFLATAIVFAAAIPWYRLLSFHISNTLTNFWIPKTTYSWAKSQILAVYAYPLPIKIIVFVAAAMGMWKLIKRNERGAAFLVSFVVGQPALMLLLSYIRPLLTARALVWPSMLFVLLLASLLSTLPLALTVAGTAALTSLQATALVEYYPPLKTKNDGELAAHAFTKFDPTTDILVLSVRRFETDMRPYIPRIFEGKVVGTMHADRMELLDKIFKARHVNRAEVASYAASYQRAWIVTEITPKFPIPAADDIKAAMESIRDLGAVEEVVQFGNLQVEVVYISRGRG